MVAHFAAEKCGWTELSIIQRELACIIGAFAAILFIFGALVPNPNATGNENRARQAYEKTKRVGADFLTPYRHDEKPKTYREEWRAERDLYAQRSMARSTYWMMWATIIGVVLLAGTLYEANRTAEAAIVATEQTKRGVEATLRPYISVHELKIRFRPDEEHWTCVSGKFLVSNRGQTPASAIFFDLEFLVQSNDPGHPAEFTAIAIHDTLPPGETHLVKFKQMARLSLGAAATEDHWVRVRISVRQRDQFWDDGRGLLRPGGRYRFHGTLKGGMFQKNWGTAIANFDAYKADGDDDE
jgi:hypothetical protein